MVCYVPIMSRRETRTQKVGHPPEAVIPIQVSAAAARWEVPSVRLVWAVVAEGVVAARSAILVQLRLARCNSLKVSSGSMMPSNLDFAPSSPRSAWQSELPWAPSLLFNWPASCFLAEYRLMNGWTWPDGWRRVQNVPG